MSRRVQRNLVALVALLATALIIALVILRNRVPEIQGVYLSPGDDVAAIVANNPAGTTFVLQPGIYRLNEIVPEDGMTFIGEDGAILSGATVLTEFEREGDFWVVTGQTKGRERENDICEEAYPRCSVPEDVFFDNQPLRHVGSLEDMERGTYFFDYDADKIYLADDPTGMAVELSTAEIAFDGDAEGVTIRNLTIEKYANLAQFGAIRGDETTNWRIEDSVIRLNHGTGIRLGDGMQVLNNRILQNGQLGIGGIGDGVLVEGNEIAYNNYAGYRAGWEGGGSKFVRTDELVVRNNYVHHNNGAGLWTDVDNINTLYEGNIVVLNEGSGIFHEISYDATIRDNIVKFNSVAWDPWLYGAQILISASSNVEVYDNQVVISAEGGNGIGIIQQDRGEGDYGPWLAYNNYVHGNTIIHLGESGNSGAAADWEIERFWRESNNRFENNTYYVISNDRGYWEWDGGRQDWEDMRAYGQELNGDLNVGNLPPDAAEVPLVAWETTSIQTALTRATLIPDSIPVNEPTPTPDNEPVG